MGYWIFGLEIKELRMHMALITIQDVLPDVLTQLKRSLYRSLVAINLLVKRTDHPMVTTGCAWIR